VSTLTTAPPTTTTIGSLRDGPAPPTRGGWGLRRRILLTFSLGALGLSVLLAMLTYGFARSSVVQQHDQASREAAQVHAIQVLGALRAGPPNATDVLEQLENIGVERPLIWYNDDWREGQTFYDETEVPLDLQERVIDDDTASRMVVDVRSEPNLLVGWPLENGESAYFEFFSLNDVNDTLRSVRLSLVLGTVITTALGMALGSFAARRAVRPVGVAAQAAKAIAGGRLDTRLEPTEDPDLSVLANSFNDMANSLQTRIERDARFASDVSHELRSPLMTLSASVEVMDARRDEMPERAQAALDLLKSDVVRFQGLVEDLLEISRFDAGAVRLHMEELLVAEFVRQAVAVSSLPDTPVEVSSRAEMMLINGDRRRLARVVANLIDNARLHGGGEPSIAITEVEPEEEGAPISLVQISVEDRGAGVPEHERELVFERFARGGVAGRRASNDGAGLGLSLVDEHVRMHGGRVWVTDRLDGDAGARFVIELPAEELDE
jgi:two-component system sensor histidine kinase MtrB